jgi:hypothetical protein
MKTKLKLSMDDILIMLKDTNYSEDEYQRLYEGFETKINKERGYLQFRINKQDKYKNVHSLVNRYYHPAEYQQKLKELDENIEIGIFLITHHKDFEKTNNHPSNLQWMGEKEHYEYHIFTMTGLLGFMDKAWNPENPEYEKHEDYRILITNTLPNLTDEIWNSDNPKYNEHESYRIKQNDRKSEMFKELWNIEWFRDKITTLAKENWKYGLGEFVDKAWNPDNPEYSNYEAHRLKQNERTSIQMKELWHGGNNQEYRDFMRPIQQEAWKKGISVYIDKIWNPTNPEYSNFSEQRQMFFDRWHAIRFAPEYAELREKMKLISSNNGLKTMNWFWYGEGNEDRREKEDEKRLKMLYELWHGHNKEFREKMSINMKKIGSVPEYKIKAKKGRIFTVFYKIKYYNEEITNETFIEYRNFGCPKPEKIFGSLANAIKEYNNYKPTKQQLKQMEKIAKKGKRIKKPSTFVLAAVGGRGIFGVFYEILINNQDINIESFKKYKSKTTPYPENVFGSYEIAIEKYKEHISNEKHLKKIQNRIGTVRPVIDKEIYRINNLRGKIFSVFNEIRESGNIISQETFLKFRTNNTPLFNDLFSSFDNALELFEQYIISPKNIKRIAENKKRKKTESKKEKIYKDPSETILLNSKSRIFGIFNKIKTEGNEINDEIYLKYRYNKSPYIKPTFKSIEDAIEQYQSFPKRFITKQEVA